MAVTLGVVNKFLYDIYGVNFKGSILDPKLQKIGELKKAHNAFNNFLSKKRVPRIDELLLVLPLLEVAVSWEMLKKEERMTEYFRKVCSQKISEANSGSAYRGKVFEIDMASRALLSDWKVSFPEIYTQGQKQIDTIFLTKSGFNTALECTEKRSTANLNEQVIQTEINDRCDKFNPKNVAMLEKIVGQIDSKILVIDITRDDYNGPPSSVIHCAETIKLCENIDGVVLTWRELEDYGDKKSIVVKYQNIGNIKRKYFTTTLRTEIVLQIGDITYFMRKYVEPEPTNGSWGKEESYSEWLKHQT